MGAVQRQMTTQIEDVGTGLRSKAQTKGPSPCLAKNRGLTQLSSREVVWGAIAGAVAGLIAYLFTGGQGDFIATSQLIADRDKVLVDPAHADRARELLQTGRI